METTTNVHLKLLNVFIVDDSQIVRDRLTSMLNELGSINIVGYADNPLSATESIVATVPDIIILDIFLAGGSGIHVLKNIRSRNISSKVIVLTNYAQEQYRKKCFEEGADFFFDKSIEFDKIVDVIQKLRIAA
ncbi:MAG: response regulator transcription factor [Ignavibacteriales bacterium]|nr:response regulator transcription factor [Ignavibacteriales bacterium]